MQRILSIALALPVLASCVGAPVRGEAGASASKGLLLPVAEEVRLGDQLAAGVERHGAVLDDEAVQAYVDRVGQRLVAVAKDCREGVRYTFTVLDAPNAFDAFALPGGHVFIGAGLVAAARSEAELASILAHEMGHAGAEHATRALATSYGLKVLGTIARGEHPTTAARIAAGIVSRGYLERHAREAERQADAAGLACLVAAGYDPGAMPRFFRALPSSGAEWEAFLASHPHPAERARLLSASIQGMEGPALGTAVIGGFDEVRARLAGQEERPLLSGRDSSRSGGQGPRRPARIAR